MFSRDSGSCQVQALIKTDYLAVRTAALGVHPQGGLAAPAQALGKAVPSFVVDGNGNVQISVQGQLVFQRRFHGYHVGGVAALLGQQGGQAPAGQGEQGGLAAGEEGALVVVVGPQGCGDDQSEAVEIGKGEVQMPG